MKRIHVVAAVIRGGAGCEDEILISKRPDHLHQGGKWEFPGGKVEDGEAPEVALVRELEEELGITATRCEPLIQIHHDYADKAVFLDVWEVSAFEGEPNGMEGQLVKWVESTSLADYEFPAANVPIVAAASLSSRYWITPEIEGSISEFIELVEAKINAGIQQMQLRLKSCDPLVLRETFDRVVSLCDRFKVQVFLNSDTFKLLESEGVSGVNQHISGIHLTGQHLQQNQRYYEGLVVVASCHSKDDIERAEQLGCQFVTLSPIRDTASHPDANPQDSENVKQWVKQAKVPVYALGGMKDKDVAAMRALGFQGVAGISEVGVSKK